MKEGDGAKARGAVALGEVTPNNLGQLKRLHTVVFPVHYNDKFYKGVLEAPEYSQLAYFNDCAVGAVCAKREPLEGKDVKVYIMTLGVLAPYRRLGVGSELLQHIIDLCERDAHVKLLYVHMQTNNDEGRKFYESKGFAVTATIERYYKNIEPAAAHVLSREFHR
eukprot:Unigene11712_Nuclearia_a/m.35696 Unigene11712_Nuclearia_a/g.35696  ORF Unigene11712_Nuclearia_a/g.35696 Unigene11712_Nuclearia_a/m.35696 type:complete len:165 (+) Unigene11712_Nuclearia_a:21-515(+)